MNPATSYSTVHIRKDKNILAKKCLICGFILDVNERKRSKMIFKIKASKIQENKFDLQLFFHSHQNAFYLLTFLALFLCDLLTNQWNKFSFEGEVFVLFPELKTTCGIICWITSLFGMTTNSAYAKQVQNICS